MKDLSWAVLAAIVGIIGFLLFGGGGDGVPAPELSVAVSPSVVHPPVTVALSIDQGKWPSGTVFSYLVDGVVAATSETVGLSAELRIADWPTQLSVAARAPDGTKKEKDVRLVLDNEIPRFHDLFIDQYPEAREWVKFWLYYRAHGCDVSGNPSSLTGIEDPDWSFADPDRPYSDRTDNWYYRCAVEILDAQGAPTGRYEPLFFPAGNQVKAIDPDEWVADPRYVWVPFWTSSTPPAGLTVADFPPPLRSPVIVQSAAFAERGGYLVGPGLRKPLGPKFAPMCGGDGTVPPPEPQEPNRLIHVWVREYGMVYHEVYRVYAASGTCP